MTRRSRHMFVVSSLCVIAIACAIAGYLYATYPKVPDVAKGDPTDALKFIASDDFNHMFMWHRSRYARAAMSRLREKPFGELMTMEPLLGAAHKNLKALPDHEQIEGLFLQAFLDRFYSLNKTQRNVVLTGIALDQDKAHPLLPAADKFKTDFAHFLASQPPHTQAQMGQFLMDVRNQRDVLGLKEPY